MKQFCPYPKCNQPLIKVGDFYICPIHGNVLREVDKEENGDKSYIN